MKLERLISDVERLQVYGDTSVECCSLSYDSRTVEAGGCFFAVVGRQSDGHLFIPMAEQRGVSAVVCERLPEQLNEGICYIVVPSTEVAMGRMATAFYSNPSRELKLVGVTGTNGKTTTATLLSELFNLLGYKTGLISTVTYRIGDREYDSTHTTPDAIRLNAMLHEMVDEGCEYAFMEVSSHSVVQSRIEGLTFEGAIFSNLTHDHLDYHGSFAEYLRAKKRLFDSLPKGAFAVTNIDDRNGEVMVQNCAARVVRYSMRSMADVRAKVVEMHFDGMLMEIDGQEVWVRLIGRFNGSNLLSLYAAARELGVEREELLVAISRLVSVNGRFEAIAAGGGRTVVIDYAHTPDALEKVLETVGEIARSVGAERDVVTVCGCGGERDQQKRPEMARVAYRASSMVIFTSDNPRSEDPEQIIAQMIEGLEGIAPMAGRRYLKITNRAEAIRTAIMLSAPGAIVVIAGKGHERYQIIGGERHHFDDHEQVAQAIEFINDNN